MYHMTLKNINTCKWFYELPHDGFDEDRRHNQYKNGIKRFFFKTKIELNLND